MTSTLISGAKKKRTSWKTEIRTHAPDLFFLLLGRGVVTLVVMLFRIGDNKRQRKPENSEKQPILSECTFCELVPNRTCKRRTWPRRLAALGTVRKRFCVDRWRWNFARSILSRPGVSRHLNFSHTVFFSLTLGSFHSWLQRQRYGRIHGYVLLMCVPLI